MEKWKLPENWKFVRLGDLLTVNYGKGLPKRARQGGNIPVYGANGVVGYHDSSITKGQTIIIGRKGSAGAVNWSEIDCWPIDTTFFIDEFPESLTPEFLHHFLRSQPLVDLQQSAAIPGLNRDTLYDVEIPIPYPDNPARSLAEQRRIVARLEAALGEVREMRALQSQIEADGGRLMGSVLAEVFGQASHVFTDKSLEEVVEIHDKGRVPIKKSERNPGDIPYCGANGVIDYVEGFTHDGEFVLLAEDGGNFKAFEQSAYMMSGKFWANNHVHVLRGVSGVLVSEYLYYVLFYADLTPYLTGATRPKLTQSAMRTVQIPIPYADSSERSLTEQRRIVVYLEAIQMEVQEARRLLDEDERAIEQLEQSILAQAFRGEI